VGGARRGAPRLACTSAPPSRVEAIRVDLARGAEAEALASRARWFVAEAARAPRGARELTVTDWSSGEERAITLPLDPAKSAKAQIDAIFNRARRMQKGMEIARARSAAAEAAILLLDARLTAVRSAGSQEDLGAVVGSPTATSPAPPRGRVPKGKPPKRRPYRLFRCAPGIVVFVGRSAADNDALTFRVARPQDLWLHARGVEGAHVVLPLDKGKAPSPEALVDAAHLAAHFSGYRSEASVEVQYATRGHVRKPRGSPPGLVVVEPARAMLVRMEPDRIARLLASEETA
jgi:predicted ribosome quality control (RQC) complex YloA/Tae2 family protein